MWFRIVLLEHARPSLKDICCSKTSILLSIDCGFQDVQVASYIDTTTPPHHQIYRLLNDSDDSLLFDLKDTASVI